MNGQKGELMRKERPQEVAGYAALVKIAIEKGADLPSIETLVKLQTGFEEKAARKAFFAALSAFQTAVPVIEKRGGVSYQNVSYSYARLEDIAKEVKPLLEKHGLSYRFEQKQDHNAISVTCIVTHCDGHSEQTEMTGMPDASGKKNPVQQLASTMTYLRRYTLTGALGLTVADEDDDAADYQAAQQPEFYPDEKFNKLFPQWKQQIESGQKTADQILSFLAKKGVNLSQHQVSIVQKVGRA